LAIIASSVDWINSIIAESTLNLEKMDHRLSKSSVVCCLNQRKRLVIG
jgi:hypothetical protein